MHTIGITQLDHLFDEDHASKSLNDHNQTN